MSVMTPQSPPELRESTAAQPQEQPQERSQRSEALTPEYRRNRGLVVGALMLLFGAVLLIETLTTWTLIPTLVMPLLGLTFLIWGSVTRHAGLIIPGGIVLGVGVGTALIAQRIAPVGGTDEGAIMLLSLALGFAVITPFTWAFTDHMHWWALIPAAVLAFLGVSLLSGEWGAQALIWFGMFWPVALIIGGAAIVWNVLRKRSGEVR